MPLQMPVQEPMKPKETPVVQMVTNEKPLAEPALQAKMEMPVASLSEAMAPRLTEAPESAKPQQKTGPFVVMPSGAEKKVQVEFPVDKKIVEEPIEWIFSQHTAPRPVQDNQPEKKSIPNNPPAVSGGYLTRPANIYDEDPIGSESLSEEIPLNDHIIFAAAIKTPVADENLSSEMQLVFKEANPAADVPGAHQTPIGTMADQPAEEPAVQDEAEGLRRRAAERINKLRNLSFNMNAADPNNEFETVPAYIRRNLELYNTVTSVESFYSQYEVKVDKNSQGEISTINSFLDGKRPD